MYNIQVRQVEDVDFVPEDQVTFEFAVHLLHMTSDVDQALPHWVLA